MKTQCPFCKKIFKAPQTYLGRMVRCVACKENFLVCEFHEPIVSPETIEKTKELVKKKAENNLFVAAWKGIPQPFKIAFLSTLGVVSGLLFSWYIFGFGNKILNREPKTQSLQATRPQVFTPESSNSENFNMTADLYYLAAAIRINQYTSSLSSLFNARITAAKTYSDHGDLSSAAKVMKCTCLQLEELNMTVSRMRIPDNKEIKEAYSALQDAIQSEYMFQQSIIDITNNPREEKLEKIKRLSQNSVSKFDTAMIQAIYILSQSDPALLEAIVTIDGNN